MEKLRIWVFLVAAVCFISVQGAPLEKFVEARKEKKVAMACRDGEVSAGTLIKAADLQSEQERRLKTLRAEKDTLHAQVCGDTDNFQASLEAARQETARQIEYNKRRCEQEVTSIVPSMTESVINANLLETIRHAMRSVIDAHFNPEQDSETLEEDQLIPERSILPRARRAPQEVVPAVVNDYKHLCPTGKATAEALLAVGEAIGRSTLEYEAMRDSVVAMKGGTCPSSIDLTDMDGKTKSGVAPPMDCGDLKRVVQLYIDSFTSQLPEVEKTVKFSLQDMLPTEAPCTGLIIGSTCYFITLGTLPFNEAVANCATHDARLAMLKDPEVHYPVKGYLDGLPVGDVWIGATDYDGDMTFTWLDGTTMDGGDWANGEPNNPRQMCAQMWRYMSLQWDDDYCVHRKNVLCEKQITVEQDGNEQ